MPSISVRYVSVLNIILVKVQFVLITNTRFELKLEPDAPFHLILSQAETTGVLPYVQLYVSIASEPKVVILWHDGLFQQSICFVCLK